ncbi:MAG: flagellar motor switch protein FliM [Beijerinckiaceae bacterium]|nr:flagellar motor switch protein FliM [Beijerinckiaceae bacterium]
MPERLVDGARMSVDRMPMLQIIFDRMASQCAEALRPLLPSPALFSVDRISTERFSAVPDAFEANVVLGIVYVQPWDSRMLLGLGHEFVFALADTLFGGDGTETSVREERPLSSIELRLAGKAFDLAAKALQTSFSAVSEAVFKFDRVETRVEFAAIAPRTAYGVKAAIRVRILGHESHMFVLIPQTALNAVRQDLARDLTPGMPVRDSRWTKQMHGEVGRTEISVRGVIEERHFTLADIARLQIGQVLALNATAKTRVKLECNAEPLFWCDLGQADGFYTLRTDAFVDQEQEFYNAIAHK